MDKWFSWAGNTAALLGFLLCTGTSGARLLKHFYLFGFELNTLFLVGSALLVGACFAKLYVIEVRLRRAP
jgi:hypothetical protein